MNCFTVLGIEPTTEKKTIKRAYAAKSREFHPEEHPEEFQRIHDAYEEALAWAERNAGRGEEPQMPEEPRRMEEESGEDRMENSREKDEKSEESATQSVEPPEHRRTTQKRGKVTGPVSSRIWWMLLSDKAWMTVRSGKSWSSASVCI